MVTNMTKEISIFFAPFLLFIDQNVIHDLNILPWLELQSWSMSSRGRYRFPGYPKTQAINILKTELPYLCTPEWMMLKFEIPRNVPRFFASGED